MIYEKGFSLVELLVVISIIGLVTGVGASFVASIQRNTRDAQRESDLRVVQSALQQFYSDKNFYPNNLTLTGEAALTDCTGQQLPCTPSKTYLSNTPQDPVPGTTTPYCYRSQISITNANNCGPNPGEGPGTCHFYVLCTTLENPSTAVDCSCTGSNTDTGNFKVAPL